MPQDSSVVVFIAFGVLALCVVIALLVLSLDWFSPVWRFLLRAFNRIRGSRYSSRYGSRYSSQNDENDENDYLRDDENNEKDDANYDANYAVSDDVSDDASQVLAMLNMPTVVIDCENDVIRASSEAYLLGIVSDDSLCQPRVIKAVNSVRSSGGFERFSLVTSTPERYAAAEDESQESTTVSRPNWLTVTVGSVGRGMVVVIIEDTSAARRFAQTRDDFISNVSDQLISSTRSLTQLTKILQDNQVSAEKIKEIAQIANKSSKKLEHMLEDLLWLVRAQNPIDISSAKVLSIANLLNLVQKQVSSFAEDSCVRIIFKADSSLRVRGEAEQIQAAIRKLVENAITYSPKNSTVSVSAALSADGQYAVIRVVDRGVGIDIKDQSRIFERFYRANNQNTKSQDGVGLGLAIAKHVALTHRGNITLWSRPGQGTTVSFALPNLPSD